MRDPRKAKERFGAGALRPFDFGDSSTFEVAATGVDRMLLLDPPLDLRMNQLLIPLIDF